jgi:RNA polymerase sigma factor (TIGR02999 family)
MTGSDLTQVLAAARDGDAAAATRLLSLVYAELCSLARARMAREAPGHTLQPTALVHEAWLRLGEQTFENRAHFFGAAAEAMRRILIDRVRRKSAEKRGGGAAPVDVDDIEIAVAPGKEAELLAVHEALDGLAAYDPRKAELVKLHWFVGLTFTEAAAILGVSEPTARRDWVFARAWLARALGKE